MICDIKSRDKITHIRSHDSRKILSHLIVSHFTSITNQSFLSTLLTKNKQKITDPFISNFQKSTFLCFYR